jgi:MFS family permease
MTDTAPKLLWNTKAKIVNWTAWAAATLFVLYQLATQTSVGAMQRELEQDLSISPMQVGIVSATFLFVYAIMQIPAGVLLDRYRPRLLLPPAALGVAAAAWLLSMSGGFWTAVAARALMGAFAAFAFPGAGLIARRRLPARNFALAMGLIDLAFGAGAYFGESGVSALMSIQSWQQVMIDFAFAGAAIAFICWVCIGSTTPRGESATVSARARPLRQSINEVWSVRQVRLAAITGGAMMATLFGFGGLWDISLQEAFGYTHEQAIAVNSWIFIGVSIVPPFAGWAADRWRKRRPILLGGQVVALAAVVVTLLVPAPMPYWFAAGTLLVLGMGLGTCVLTFPVACDAVSPANAGAAIGMVNAAGLLAAAVFQVVPGVAFNLAGDHSLLIMRTVLAIFAVALLAGAVATWKMTPCPIEPR